MARLLFAIIFVVVSQSGCSPLATRTEASESEHLRQARMLISRLELKNTSYEHQVSEVRFDGEVQSHTDCSGFMVALLSKSYGLTREDVIHWFTHPRALARDFHEAIKTNRGFTRIEKIAEIEAGDLIAIRYTVRKQGNTGHVLLVSGRPYRLQSKGEWGLNVIDSSHTGHGPTDTRYSKGEGGKDHDGLGEGVFRLYEDSEGGVRGFSWSTREDSVFRLPNDEHLLVGRLRLPLNP